MYGLVQVFDEVPALNQETFRDALQQRLIRWNDVPEIVREGGIEFARSCIAVCDPLVLANDDVLEGLPELCQEREIWEIIVDACDDNVDNSGLGSCMLTYVPQHVCSDREFMLKAYKKDFNVLSAFRYEPQNGLGHSRNCLSVGSTSPRGLMGVPTEVYRQHPEFVEKGPPHFSQQLCEDKCFFFPDNLHTSFLWRRWIIL